MAPPPLDPLTLPPPRASSAAPPTLSAHAISHAGQKRAQNEDAFGSFIEDRLFIVADGMGGRSGGEVASHLAVEELATFFRRYHQDPRQIWPYPVDPQRSLGANLLAIGMKVANDKIRAAALADPSRARMACTIVALAVGDGQLWVAHAGDSRAYRFRDRELQRLTTDHSVLAEILAARPDMGEAEISRMLHRNVVTRALGSKPQLDPTVLSQPLHPGDCYLLCSDGLWNTVPDSTVAAILSSTDDLEAACQLLIDAANDTGGPDNITALVVRIG